MKKLIGLTLIIILSVVLVACNQADRVSKNLAQESDSFNTVRKVTVINAIKNDIIFTMTGRMSIKADKEDNQLEVVVENKDGKYQKHIIGLSDNVSYVVEDITTKNVSKYQYEINYNPKMWIPAKPKYVD
ncbi:beta-sandwich lipoprotein, partial [Staphylococcus xylosus]